MELRDRCQVQVKLTSCHIGDNAIDKSCAFESVYLYLLLQDLRRNAHTLFLALNILALRQCFQPSITSQPMCLQGTCDRTNSCYALELFRYLA